MEHVIRLDILNGYYYVHTTLLFFVGGLEHEPNYYYTQLVGVQSKARKFAYETKRILFLVFIFTREREREYFFPYSFNHIWKPPKQGEKGS